ncbi:hypothetical protein V565_322990 [Rhizoctonia solani 123E]|uniref:DUF659 family protein n=1 Tax=Rhizoctonia solani 123E TaxID=1423351 RepID=A0A074RI31_9AGAM|nr:hypothetical protein V565_322990 [Rhizoctonia solani 123E]
MPHWIWDYFATDGTKSNSSNKNVWCRYDLMPIVQTLMDEDQLSVLRGEISVPRSEKALILEESVLRSKIDIMLRHVRDKCIHASPELKQQANDELASRKSPRAAQLATVPTNTGNTSAIIPPAPAPRPTGSRSTQHAPIVLLTPVEPANTLFPPEQQEEFAADLLNVISACGLPFYVASHPVFKNFLHKYARGARIPCRQILSGRVLDKQVARAEECVKGHTRGKLAMGQCDGWKNIARTPVIAVMMTVEGQPYVLQVHDVGIQSKTAENLVEIMKNNMSFATEKYGIEWIGWCTDAGGDAKKARRLAFIAFPWLICPDCWAHHNSQSIDITYTHTYVLYYRLI